MCASSRSLAKVKPNMLYIFTIGTKTQCTNYRDTEVQGQQKTGVCRQNMSSESAVTSPRADLRCIYTLQKVIRQRWDKCIYRDWKTQLENTCRTVTRSSFLSACNLGYTVVSEEPIKAGNLNTLHYFEVRHPHCVIQIPQNEVKSSRNTTKGILAKLGSG